MAITPRSGEMQRLLKTIAEKDLDVEQTYQYLDEQGIDREEFSNAFLTRIDELGGDITPPESPSVSEVFGAAQQLKEESPVLGTIVAPALALKGIKENFSGVDILGSVLGQTGENISQVAGDIVEVGAQKAADMFNLGYMVDPKETRQRFENVFKKAADSVEEEVKQTELGQKALRQTKEFFDPELNTGEEIAAEVGEFLVPLVGATKLLKVGEATTKAKKLAKAYGAAVSADMFYRDEDEQFFHEIITNNLNPDLQESLAAFALDPDDTVAERRLKQLGDSLAFEASAGLALATALGIVTRVPRGARRLKDLGKDGIDKARILSPYMVRGLKAAAENTVGKRTALKKNKVLTPVEASNKAVATDVKVEKIAPKEYRQQGIIKETIGALNTGMGRLFTSKTGLPDPIFKADVERRGALTSSEKLIKYEVGKLKRQLDSASKIVGRNEKFKYSIDETLQGKVPSEKINYKQELVRLIDKYLKGDVSGAETEILRREFPKLYDTATEARRTINAKELQIKKDLGMREDEFLTLGIGKDNVPYLTRSFEFHTNPKWSKQIQKVLEDKNLRDYKGRIPFTDHNVEVIRVVQNARNYFKDRNPRLTEDEIDGAIDEMMKRAGKEDILDTFINIFNSGASPNMQKVLKGRKNLDQPILDLLGEIKDPVRNFQQTLINQTKLQAELDYLKEIKRFAEDNIGKEVKLPGLIPDFVPVLGATRTTTFAQRPTGAGRGAVSTRVAPLAQERLGRLGGRGDPLNLGELATTQEFSKMLNNGIDVFGIDKPFGNAFVRALQNVTAYAQANETVFDHTAHLQNMVGMTQALAMNGTLLRPAGVEAATKSIHKIAMGAAKGDKASLEYMKKLKDLGVIDSNVITESMKANLDNLAEGMESFTTKTLKSPIRGASKLYGGVDDFGKMIAHEVEMKAYRKAFPNATDDEVFEYAAEVVRNTMPSYSTAIPIVRLLSRLPFGTYASYPAEVLRTQKNIVSIALKDIAQGTATNNPRLVATGVRRISALAATTVAIGATVKQNNDMMGITQDTERGFRMMSPDFQKTTTKFFTQPPIIDENNNFTAQFVDTGYLEANQSTKSIVKTLNSRVLIGDTPTQREVDELFTNAASEFLGPYFSAKFLPGAFAKALMGYDPDTGKPIGRGMSKLEDAGIRTRTVLETLVPATIKLEEKIQRADKSEELRGEGFGQTASGFPMKAEDLRYLRKTGLRRESPNVDSGMGLSVYQDLQDLNNTKSAFNDYLKNISDRRLTNEDIQNIYQKAHEYYGIERQRHANLKDKIDVFANMDVYRYNKDTKNYDYGKLGYGRTLYGITREGRYNLDRRVLSAIAEQGVYLPSELIDDKKTVSLFRDRLFGSEVLQGIKQIRTMYAGLPLREEEK